MNYHIFNLLGFFNLAKIGDNIGIDLWNYETPDGSGLQKALDYLLPFALGNDTWPYTQIKPINKDGLHDLICQAAVHYENYGSYEQVYRSLDELNITRQIDGLIYGCTSLIFNN